MGNIVIAGGNGFIGRALVKRSLEEGDRVTILTRGRESKEGMVRELHWDGQTLGDWAQALEGADMLINLAGKSVDCRYNAKNKRAILDSRVEPTRVLGEAVQRAERPPKLWINASTATIYRHAEDRPMDEETGEIGEGFSVDVATSWEKAFFEQSYPGGRRVALRSAIVLGKEGGVFKPFWTLVRMGLGGVQGNGRQIFSWVHEDDLFRIIRFIQAGTLEGVVNVSSPGPISNRELMATFRKALHMPFGLPLPGWLIAVGAWIARTEPELLLKSRWVVPTKLLKAGYRFQHSTLGEALTSLA
ncbi:MAG TPA: TIGR01777 family oxidoreductase [bacterium]|nr:TIGR01777 family oxidoreductase [bacterium]